MAKSKELTLSDVGFGNKVLINTFTRIKGKIKDAPAAEQKRFTFLKWLILQK